jgi:hypothetical protein
VAPELVHPDIGWTIARLWEHLQTAPDYFAVTGPPHAGKTALVRRVGQALQLRVLEDPVGPARGAGRRSGQWTSEDEMRLVRRRLEPLQAAHPAVAGGTVISDYWLGQSWAYLASAGFAEEQASCLQALNSLLEEAPKAKLLVRVEPVTGDGENEPQSPATLLRKAIRRYHEGPVLEVPASDPERAFAELSAAIESMR